MSWGEGGVSLNKPLTCTTRFLLKGETNLIKEPDNSILQLCIDAYRLAINPRKSRATYVCETWKEATPIDEGVKDHIIPQAFEGSSKIAFTMFGAFLKYPEPTLDEWCPFKDWLSGAG